MKLFLIFVTFVFFMTTFSQSVYYQETCKCGVTGAGFSTGLGAGSGSFDIYIEPGSTIKKAFLFATKFGNTNDTSILLNNVPFYFNSSTQISNEFNLIGTGDANNISIHKIDVTNFINPTITNYSVSIPLQMSCSGCSYNCIYLYVIYENPIFASNVSSYVLINNKDEGFRTDYDFTNFNAITNSDPIGFAIYSDRMNNSEPFDGSYLYFNNGFSINVGLLKGSDNVNSSWDGAGVKGHFYYQNNTLFGLDDDTPDDFVGGSDGLLKVNNYINNNSLNWFLEGEINPSTGINNLYSGFFITHSTPCDTFSVSIPNDTTVCYGSQTQLNASGGQTYEWLPATGLSCSDCPNPVFTADSAMHYTVRIWNNDTCSVVRPIKINVLPLPTFEGVTVAPTTCGTANGTVVLTTSSSVIDTPEFSMNGGSTQTTGTFNNLAEGNYSFTITDGLGCVSEDTMITVGVINPTVASFTIDPTSGLVPLNVNITNTSQNASDFSWSINGVNQGGSLNSQTLYNAGTYSFELAAWQYDASCADTVTITVIVLNEIIIPTAFTPDDNLINDFWEIENLDEQYPKNTVQIFNRWGNLVYESIEGKYGQQPWKGDYKGEKLLVGSYYYIIELNDGETKAMIGTVSILVK